MDLYEPGIDMHLLKLLGQYENEGLLSDVMLQWHEKGARVVAVLTATTAGGEDLVVTGHGITHDIAREDAARKMLNNL